jgi:spore coat protein CotH
MRAESEADSSAGLESSELSESSEHGDENSDGDGSSADDESDSSQGETTTSTVESDAEIYDSENFPRFELEIDAAGLLALKASPFEYVDATFHYNDEKLDHVGVRLKGNSSFRDMSKKAAFKIKFDAFEPGQSFRGLRRLTLNNMLDDWSMIAEVLTYEVFRHSGMPAPRANHAQVYVNGEYFGVYANVESEDKAFLRRWFASDAGNLYERQNRDDSVAGERDWAPGQEMTFDLETNETENDRSDLTELFAATEAAADATLLADVDSILDTQSFLRYCALEAIVNQWDGFAYGQWGPNNHRLYYEPSSGKFVLLPWGMDMSLKPGGKKKSIDPDQSLSFFVRRCIAAPSCRTAFHDAIRGEADQFAQVDLAKRSAEIWQRIGDAVMLDPRKESSMMAILGGIAGIEKFGKERRDEVLAQIDDARLFDE